MLLGMILTTAFHALKIRILKFWSIYWSQNINRILFLPNLKPWKPINDFLKSSLAIHYQKKSWAFYLKTYPKTRFPFPPHLILHCFGNWRHLFSVLFFNFQSLWPRKTTLDFTIGFCLKAFFPLLFPSQLSFSVQAKHTAYQRHSILNTASYINWVPSEQYILPYSGRWIPQEKSYHVMRRSVYPNEDMTWGLYFLL